MRTEVKPPPAKEQPEAWREFWNRSFLAPTEGAWSLLPRLQTSCLHCETINTCFSKPAICVFWYSNASKRIQSVTNQGTRAVALDMQTHPTVHTATATASCLDYSTNGVTLRLKPVEKLLIVLRIK